jgi:hypothetical protein
MGHVFLRLVRWGDIYLLSGMSLEIPRQALDSVIEFIKTNKAKYGRSMT